MHPKEFEPDPDKRDNFVLTYNDRNNLETMFFAAYAGTSMNPTLRGPEMMEIMPYDRSPLRVGDVVFFVPLRTDQPVVHRIVRVTPAGISTFGDNNTHEDTFLLQSGNIKGRVVAAWCGQKRRKIAGGLKGWLTGRWLHWRGVLDRSVSPVLHSLYYALSHRAVIARLLPAPFRPRVIVFHARGRDQFHWDRVSLGDTMSRNINGISNGHFACLWMIESSKGNPMRT
jgi:hypothetical protein